MTFMQSLQPADGTTLPCNPIDSPSFRRRDTREVRKLRCRVPLQLILMRSLSANAWHTLTGRMQSAPQGALESVQFDYAQEA
jgi:hypothetical protein